MHCLTQFVPKVPRIFGDVPVAVGDLGATIIVLDGLDKYDGNFDILTIVLFRLVSNSTCNIELVVIVETSFGGGE